MAPAYPSAELGHWFIRGAQSALFYYLSCAPLVERKHKKKRRREAQESAKERGDIITKQPGLLRQPGPFQTNEGWAEELRLGPGPPKGWKKDKITMAQLEPVYDPASFRPATRQREESTTVPPTSYDYNKGKNPEVNDMHPPIVSRLPATKEEAAWMLMPPPCAAVMAGKMASSSEPAMRRPLCVGPPKPTEVPIAPLSAPSIGQEATRGAFSEATMFSDDLHSEADDDWSHLNDDIEEPVVEEVPAPPIYMAPRYDVGNDIKTPRRRGSEWHYFVALEPA